jgi:hypothetical protein
VYDSKLNFVKIHCEGALSPMHVTAAVFLEGPMLRLQLYTKGRGGWHMSILYVFSSTGKLVYKKLRVLPSITSVAQGDKRDSYFGRNEVLRYSFKR